ncbi:MAG: hypothetical protein WDZ31_04950 [Phycisphaeraceae bacterium]
MTTTTPPDHDLLLAYVRDRDVPCPRCRYNLRDIERPYCPECGTQPTLTVGDAQQPLGAWLLLTIMLWFAASSGAHSVFRQVVLVMYFGADHLVQFLSFPETLDGIAVLINVLCLPTAVVMLLTRRRYSRMPLATQWRVSGAVSGVLVLMQLAQMISYAVTIMSL